MALFQHVLGWCWVLLGEIILYYDALTEYIKRMGGQLYVSGKGIVDVYLPVIVEEVPGGVQYHLIGKLVDDKVVVYKCIVMYQDEIHEVKPEELANWANYINTSFRRGGE